MKRLAVALLAGAHCSLAFAQTQDDALAWLESIYQATRRLNYAGVFTYKNGREVETARIIHIVDGANVHERIEVLDGPLREIIRSNDEVRCYTPATMTVKIEKNLGDRPLLPVLPGNFKGIADNYRMRLAGVDRVAGNDCQSLVLEPRDALRYGHQLCADVRTRMVLKAQTLDSAQEPMEGFAFTQIEFGGAIPREWLRPRFASLSRDWRVEETDAVAVVAASSAWTLQNPPSGFQRLAELKRRFRSAPDVSQIVLSDGLSAVSVFIEPVQGRQPPPSLGASRRGALHAFTRKIDEHLVTAVGDAPAECVQTIANGVRFRGSQ
ncbi:MAG: MucB/RseB C-terminal domain-containing protein [Burkholderiales bacterium]